MVARHCEISPAVRERAETRAGRLARYENRIAAVELIFDEEKHTKWVEGVVSIDGAEAAVARGSGTAFSEAVDDLMNRLTKILRRERSRAKEHQGPRISELDSVPEE